MSFREDRLKERVEEVRPKLSKARAIAELAERENREFTAEEKATYDQIMTEGRSDTWSANATYLAAGFGITTACLVLLVVLQAVELHQEYRNTTWGSVAEGFAAVGTVLAVAVALWQSTVVRRQAEQEATEAANRFQRELDAANDRHRAELEAQRELARVQVEAQVELARVQRVYLREQEFKLALIRVSRAANAYTHELATLIEEGRRAAELPEKRDREDALLANSKKLGVLAEDFALEVQGAHMLTNKDELHDALDRVNAAGLAGPYAEMAVRNPIIQEGRFPEPIPIFQVMSQLQHVLGDARRLAGDLLDTGWD